MNVQDQNGLILKNNSAKSTRQKKEAAIGWLFLSPWVIGFVLLKALPILAALIISLTNFHMLNPEETKFIGLTNYIQFFGDADAGSGLAGSLSYFLVTVPVELVVALLLAAIFTSDRVKNKRFSRTLIFMTSIIPATSIFFIYFGSLDTLNELFTTPLNLPPIQGFQFLLPFMALWSIGPGFLIMYGAMESVPNEVYEAARVDGAGPLARFLYITLPMISPAIFFTIVINLTGAFGGAVLLDRGYILNFSLSPIEGYINSIIFGRFDLGYASTVAWVAFSVMMALTIFLFRSSKRWVYFPEDDEDEII